MEVLSNTEVCSVVQIFWTKNDNHSEIVVVQIALVHDCWGDYQIVEVHSENALSCNGYIFENHVKSHVFRDIFKIMVWTVLNTNYFKHLKKWTGNVLNHCDSPIWSCIFVAKRCGYATNWSLCSDGRVKRVSTQERGKSSFSSWTVRGLYQNSQQITTKQGMTVESIALGLRWTLVVPLSSYWDVKLN